MANSARTNCSARRTGLRWDSYPGRGGIRIDSNSPISGQTLSMGLGPDMMRL